MLKVLISVGKYVAILLFTLIGGLSTGYQHIALFVFSFIYACFNVSVL